jgi:hypothetical protein
LAPEEERGQPEDTVDTGFIVLVFWIRKAMTNSEEIHIAGISNVFRAFCAKEGDSKS